MKRLRWYLHERRLLTWVEPTKWGRCDPEGGFWYVYDCSAVLLTGVSDVLGEWDIGVKQGGLKQYQSGPDQGEVLANRKAHVMSLPATAARLMVDVKEETLIIEELLAVVLSWAPLRKKCMRYWTRLWSLCVWSKKFHFMGCWRPWRNFRRGWFWGSASCHLLPTVWLASDCRALKFKAWFSESAGHEPVFGSSIWGDGFRIARLPVLFCAAAPKVVWTFSGCGREFFEGRRYDARWGGAEWKSNCFRSGSQSPALIASYGDLPRWTTCKTFVIHACCWECNSVWVETCISWWNVGFFVLNGCSGCFKCARWV